MRDLIPHPEEERSYAELRAEYRAENLARIRALLKDHKVPRWNPQTQRWDMISTGFKVMGETLADKGILKPEDRARFLDATLIEPVKQTFGLEDVSPSVADKLRDLAHKALLHESVTWDDSVEGVVDHDAPECAPIENMTDLEIFDYVDQVLEESKGE